EGSGCERRSRGLAPEALQGEVRAPAHGASGRAPAQGERPHRRPDRRRHAVDRGEALMAVRLRPKFELRRMRPDDLEEVMVIERAAFRHPWSTELFRRELEHDWSTILVCVEPLTSAAG